jgi:hypothetical protein
VDPTTDACEPLTGFTPGRIAVIDRGDCFFIEKVKRAEDAGAVAAVVVNNEGDDWVGMIRPPDDTTVITIPSVFMRQSDGESLKAALDEGIEVHIFIPQATDPSLRWVQGEEDVIVIRDMWNPNCLGDPAKVSDPLYWCSFDDDGGVHINCGVTNLAYALLVDGGSFNGRTVQAIGLTKATHIYWRAMANYQVHLTDFAMHADAVELSCQDLIGQDLTDLITGATSSEVMTASDCTQLAEALAATEMRQMPPCDPIITVLDPDAPALDGNRESFFDDFEDGPGQRWALSNEGVYAEYEPRDWQWTTDVPEGGFGAAMYAVNGPIIGDCEAGSDDQSGVMYLESPPITILGGDDPVLVFDHYLATERSFDGGNLKIGVNDGPFELVPDEAFLFNDYNSSLNTAEQDNTNPLAGEPAFTGTDWGTARSNWGQSQVDLSGLATPGDTIRVRFDFGVDGCVGADGWYMDNVRVLTTVDKSPRRVRRRHSP